MNLSSYLPVLFRSGSETRRPADRSAVEGRLALLAKLSLALFLFFGGSGAPFPLMVMPMMVLGLVALGAALWFHLFVRPIRIGFWPAGLLLGLGVLAVLVQFLPLPFSLWSSLPGRDLARDALLAASVGEGWRPFSLAPAYSRSAAFTLLPALAIFLLVAGFDAGRRLQMVQVALAVILLSAVVGLVQFLSPGNEAVYLSPRAIFTQPSGVFANRNFQADMMLLGIICCTLLAKLAQQARGRSGVWGWTLGIIGFLALMALATQSRFGFLGLVVVLSICLFVLFNAAQKNADPRRDRGRDRPSVTALLGRYRLFIIGALLLLPLLAVLALFGGVLDRFNVGPTEDTVGSLRVAVIPDILLAIGQYFPFGSGLGTFDPVYRSVESLELVTSSYLNHAHNDYLELALELGLLGIALPVIFIAALVIATLRLRRERSGSARALGFAAAGGLAVLLLHSIADYPLRTISLQCLFALFAAILFVPAPPPDEAAVERSGTEPRPRRRAPIAIALLVAIVAGSIPIVQTQLARQAVQGRAPALALMADPSNPRALALQAELQQTALSNEEAVRSAAASVDASPLEAKGLNALGMARNALDPGTGDAALTLSARLGWRERGTQSWMVERALLAGRWDVAFHRAEALARIDRERSTAYGFLAILTTQADARTEMVSALEQRPIWRRQFLTNDDDRTLEQRQGQAQVLTALAQTDAPPTLAEARPTIDGLVREGEIEAAWSLYRATVPARRGTRDNLAWGGDFALTADEYVPGPQTTVFDWRTYEAGASFGAIEKVIGTDQQALALGGGFGDSGRLAEKTLRLAPGRYRLSWRARRDAEDDPAGLSLSVMCIDGASLVAVPLDRGTTDEWKRFSSAITVPASGCEGQRLVFGVGGVEPGDRPILYVDDVVIAPAS